MLKTLTIHPPPAWRYQCQSTQCTITIKCAIYGTCDPLVYFYSSRRDDSSDSPGKEMCVYILPHQSLGHSILRYAFVACMLSYAAYLETHSSAHPLYFCVSIGAKYWSDIDSLCSLLFHCFMEGLTGPYQAGRACLQSTCRQENLF